jgi:hypothetical protein
VLRSLAGRSGVIDADSETRADAGDSKCEIRSESYAADRGFEFVADSDNVVEAACVPTCGSVERNVDGFASGRDGLVVQAGCGGAIAYKAVAGLRRALEHLDRAWDGGNRAACGVLWLWQRGAVRVFGASWLTLCLGRDDVIDGCSGFVAARNDVMPMLFCLPARHA